MPCEGSVAPLDATTIAALQQEFTTPWDSEDNKKIHKKFKFKNFVEAMQFVNRVAELAETEGHHPDIIIHYNCVTLTLWTHAIGGLSQNDFILAAKINTLGSSF